MADKKVYTVEGSEDGTLGIYSNLRKAHARAIQYLSQNNNGTNIQLQVLDGYQIKLIKGTYSNTAKHFKHYASLKCDTDGTTVDITRYYLND
ncbi:MAG: hypothetical protein V3R78_10060 [Thermodesulfobacteriota bacterium]